MRTSDQTAAAKEVHDVQSGCGKAVPKNRNQEDQR